MLDGRTILEIARRCGLHAADIPRDLIAQAREYDGYNGKTAAQYFEGYILDTYAEMYAEQRADRDFEYRAYGARNDE